MRKFAANYLVSDTGGFLKNGMAIAGEDGHIVQYMDTRGDLREVERLSFHNGILMGAYKFSKTVASQPFSLSEQSFQSMALQSIGEFNQLTIQDHIDWCKKLQVQFPQMKIPVIMNEMEEILRAEGGFTKETLSGIYLLTGVDLVNLHFTTRSRLKKIL